MKISEAISSMKVGPVITLYFLKGNDQFLQSFFIENMSRVFFKEHIVDKTLMVPDDMKGKEIIDRLTASDLFSSKKLYILKNPQQLKGKTTKDLFSYCRTPMESHVLVMMMDDWMDRTAFSKKMEEIIKPIYLNNN